MENTKKTRWTKEEEKYLRENYKIMFYPDIAEHLGRSYESIKQKAKRLALKCGPRGRNINQKKENNGNWKGGISKDAYHYKKIDAKKYPKKHRARRAVERAVISGRLYKPDRCEDCKKTFNKDKIEGHHEDYDKPLEVIWLCRTCHREADKKL